MLMPKRVKYRKQMRGRMRGKALRGAEVSFGDFGLQALEPGWVSARQIEAGRRALVRVMKRRGKVWIRIFPDKPYTQKPPETRMGKGKGNVEYWVAVVKPGRMMFEVGGLDAETAIEAMTQASYKFSIQTKVVARHEVHEQHAQSEDAGEQE
jgi:large subunit ribosomal protein L16